jgi:hypothetical protein
LILVSVRIGGRLSKNKVRSLEPITIDDLGNLRKLALAEHANFFERNPHLKVYRDSLIGIFLCQGAACHYLDLKTGVKDWDIWHFYVETGETFFPYRGHRRLENGYKGKPIDFLKRAISSNIFQFCKYQPEATVMNYLLEKNTKTKRDLLKKAIIGLHPDAVFGMALWKGK